jgi:hypothetical protein
MISHVPLGISSRYLSPYRSTGSYSRPTDQKERFSSASPVGSCKRRKTAPLCLTFHRKTNNVRSLYARSNTVSAYFESSSDPSLQSDNGFASIYVLTNS